LKCLSVLARVVTGAVIGALVGYAYCHEPFLDLLCSVHGVLIGGLVGLLVIHGWIARLLVLFGMASFIVVEGLVGLKDGDITFRLEVLNVLLLMLGVLLNWGYQKIVASIVAKRVPKDGQK